MTREIGFWDLKDDNTKTLIWIGACLGVASYVMACAILIFGPFGGRWECVKWSEPKNVSCITECSWTENGEESPCLMRYGNVINESIFIENCEQIPKMCLKEVFVRDVK